MSYWELTRNPLADNQCQSGKLVVYYTCMGV